MICCCRFLDSPPSSSGNPTPRRLLSADKSDKAALSALSAPGAVVAPRRSLRADPVIQFASVPAACNDSDDVIEAPTVEGLRSKGVSEELISKYLKLKIPTMIGTKEELQKFEALYKRDWVRVQLVKRALPPLDPSRNTAPWRTP